jgi:hypothetical protein
MLVSTEAIKQDLDRLTHHQLQQVADFIAFLKFRNQHQHRLVLDPTQLSELFTEFAEEDRALAEKGMSDYEPCSIKKIVMTSLLNHGQIWLADLNPTQGSEQAGIFPVIIFQNDLVSKFSTTVIAIPLTTNQRRAPLPICLPIKQGNGGLTEDSVALCF